MWKNGKQDGKGEFLSGPNGTWKKGKWLEGKRICWLDEEINNKGDLSDFNQMFINENILNNLKILLIVFTYLFQIILLII